VTAHVLLVLEKSPHKPAVPLKQWHRCKICIILQQHWPETGAKFKHKPNASGGRFSCVRRLKTLVRQDTGQSTRKC